MKDKIKVGETVRWWVRSTEDPRWNNEGLATIRLGGGPPSEIVMALHQLEQNNGDKPEDLTWGYEH